MNLKHSLFTLATALCLGWLTVGCQEELDNEPQPVTEGSATAKKNHFTNTRLIDSTLVYDLSITVSKFNGSINDPIKEAGSLINRFSGTLTLTIADSIFLEAIPFPTGAVINRWIIYTGSYLFTDATGASFERTARVLANSSDPLNPRIVSLQIIDLPGAGNPSLRYFELSEDFSDFVERVDKGDVSVNADGKRVVLNYAGDYQEPDTPLACGAEFVFFPSNGRILIQPGDRFTLSENLLQTPSLARVEYIHEPRGTFGNFPTADPDLFLGAATEGDFSITYELPEVAVFDADRVFANLFDAAGNLLSFKVPALLIQDGQPIPLIEEVDGDTVFIPITFADSDGLRRRSERIELFDDQDQLVAQGGTIEINYEVECPGSYDATFFVIPPGEEPVELGERNGAVSVSVNGGPAQELAFNDEEYTRVGLVRGPIQLSDTRIIVPAPITLDLQAGNNTIIITALDDRPINLYRTRISKAPNPETFDHN